MEKAVRAGEAQMRESPGGGDVDSAPTSRRLNVVMRSPPLYREVAKMARPLPQGVRPFGRLQSSNSHRSRGSISSLKVKTVSFGAIVD